MFPGIMPLSVDNSAESDAATVNPLHTVNPPSQPRNIAQRNSKRVANVPRTVRERWQQIWNWKSAVLSAVLRALVFLAINWTSGKRAAFLALGVEFVYRVATSGFYGSLIQAFSRLQPAWKATLYVVLVLPAINQGLDWWIHWLNGTPKLAASLIASSVITVWAALFNLYAMRRGVLVTGRDARPFREDLVQLPALVAGFVLLVPRMVLKGVSR
jgi:hypothetical protein